MTDVKRRYDGSRRRAQAAATRRDVVDAAGELFTAQGYAATSVDAIAARAGVSRETIFKTFGNKRHVLRHWVERQVAGEEAEPIAEQHWVDDLRAAADGDRRIEIAAAALSEIHGRSIDALVALRAAAHSDPDIADLWRLACHQRRDDVATLAADLTATDPARDGRPDDRLVDVLYTLTSPETFELLVRQCGWSLDEYRRWIATALAGALRDRTGTASR